MGQVITFYSYKGGVGRSMALANVAALLSRWGYKTLAVDWDLEAPGLENYFRPHLDLNPIHLKGGVVELLEEASSRPEGGGGQLPWRDYLVSLELPGRRAPLDLLGAGIVDGQYFRRLRNFDLHEFYLEKRGGYAIEALRSEWRQDYDFVLIDSRTGVTDIGGVCTIQLPDILVLLFTSNEQNVAGTAEAGRSAARARRELPFDRLKLLTVPVASRFDADTEFDLSEDWLVRSAGALADLYADWLSPGVTPLEALKLTLIPYRAYFSFGEQLAVVREETATNYSLSYAYETLAALLARNLRDFEQLRSNRDSFVKHTVRARTDAGLRPAAFISYVHDDDKFGHVTTLRERLGDEVRIAVGTEFPIFQDRKDIKWGDKWRQRIEDSLDAVTFLIPIITPSFFNSAYCRAELQRFLERERRLNRNDLIIPIYLVDTPLLNEDDLRATDELAQAVASRPYADWRELRFEPLTNPQVGRTLERLARQIRNALPRLQSAGRPPTPAAPPPADTAAGDGAEPPPQRHSAKNEPPACIVNPMPRAGDFTTISEAVEKSAPGTRIIVQPGFYQEGLVIDKPLEIIGEGEPGEVVVQASDANVILFQTTLGRVANLTLRATGSGFVVSIDQGRLELEDCDIIGRDFYCVGIHDGADPRLRRNRIHDSKVGGVLVYDKGFGTLEDNDIFSNGTCGVDIRDGGNPTLRRNIIRYGWSGIIVHKAGLGTAEDNYIHNNRGSGVRVTEGGAPTLRRNRITGNLGPGIFINQGGGGVFEDNDLRDNAGGAWVALEADLAKMTLKGNVEG